MRNTVTSKKNRSVARTVERVEWLLVCLGGAFLLVRFAFGGSLSSVTAALCVVGFIAGGVRIAIGSASDMRSIEVDAAGAITFASALVLGPFGAAGPAVMAGFGGILLNNSHSHPFKESIYQVAKLPIQAALSGLAFSLAREYINTSEALTSLLSACVAAVAYTLSESLLAYHPIYKRALAMSLGFGYGLAGAANSVPPFVLLIVSLPVAATLLSLLRRERIQQEMIEAPEEQAEETAKPSLLDPLTGLANRRYLEMFLQSD
jgi:hypothetical protein